MASGEKSSRKAEWKKGKTLQMPTAIPPLLEEIREGLGRNEKQQWAVVTAAVLHLLDAPRDVQAHYVDETLLADTGPEGIAQLIGRARRGELREAAGRRQMDAMKRVMESTPPSRLAPDAPARPRIAGARPRVGGA